jgi:hypothetical protein
MEWYCYIITASVCIVNPVVEPNLIKLIGFERIIEGVNHIFDAFQIIIYSLGAFIESTVYWVTFRIILISGY